MNLVLKKSFGIYDQGHTFSLVPNYRILDEHISLGTKENIIRLNLVDSFGSNIGVFYDTFEQIKEYFDFDYSLYLKENNLFCLKVPFGIYERGDIFTKIHTCNVVSETYAISGSDSHYFIDPSNTCIEIICDGKNLPNIFYTPYNFNISKPRGLTEENISTLKSIPGIKGDRGEMGPRGLQGKQGERGLQGFPGQKGDPGDRGPRGERGQKGDRGEPGRNGIDGLPGPQGIAGPPGAAGKDGLLRAIYPLRYDTASKTLDIDITKISAAFGVPGGGMDTAFKQIVVDGVTLNSIQYTDETFTINSGSNVSIVTDSSTNSITISSLGGGGGGSNTSTSLTVNQVGHGLTTGDAIYFDGTTWLKAQANSASTLGIAVASVVNANYFNAIFSGFMELSGLSAGNYYFVSSTTPGILTTDTSTISNPVLFATGVTQGIVLPWRPTTNTDSGSSSAVGTSTSLRVTQNSHGLSTGDAIYFDGTAWLKAQANSANTLGIAIAKYISDNSFDAIFSGFMELAGLSSGNYYFVSSITAGVLTVDSSSISNPVLFATGVTQGIVLPWRPTTNTDSGSSSSAVGTSTSLRVTQTSHGLSTGDAIYFNGTLWLKAQSNSASTLGIAIAKYISDNSFDAIFSGFMELSGLSAGNYYFVSSTTAGLLGVDSSNISNPVLFATGVTQGIVLPWRPTTNANTGTQNGIVTITGGNYYVDSNDNIMLGDASITSVNMYLPNPYNNSGKQYKFKKIDSSSNYINILPNTTETIEGTSSKSLTTQYTHFILSSDGSQWWVVG